MRVGQSRKRDAAEPAIVDALEAVGVLVLLISAEGAPDLLTYRTQVWRPVEVKSSPNGRPLTMEQKLRSLTKAQREVYAIAPFPIVSTIDEAFAAVGLVRRGLTRPYVAGEDA